MARGPLLCWHCGASLAALPLPLGRREECPTCAANLHCCRQCSFYDPAANKACREPMADEVTEKEAGNFCDYFQPQPGLRPGGDDAARAAKERLARLFDPGKAPATPGAPAGSAAVSTPSSATGSGASPSGGALSEAEAARRKLEDLFGKGKR